MQPSYVPSRDHDLAAWMDNFSTLVSASPASYGLAAPDAALIADAVGAYAAALAAATNPETRTSPAIAAKDGARAAMLAVVRPYAIQIRSGVGVANEAKLNLGLTIPDPTKTPIPAPATAPILAVVAATFGAHTLRYADASAPDRRAKPFGAVALQVFRTIGEGVAGDPAQALYMTMVTTQPFTSQFASGDNGRRCTYFARWITRAARVGPWSAPVSYTIVS